MIKRLLVIASLVLASTAVYTPQASAALLEPCQVTGEAAFFVERQAVWGPPDFPGVYVWTQTSNTSCTTIHMKVVARDLTRSLVYSCSADSDLNQIHVAGGVIIECAGGEEFVDSLVRPGDQIQVSAYVEGSSTSTPSVTRNVTCTGTVDYDVWYQIWCNYSGPVYSTTQI